MLCWCVGVGERETLYLSKDQDRQTRGYTQETFKKKKTAETLHETDRQTDGYIHTYNTCSIYVSSPHIYFFFLGFWLNEQQQQRQRQQKKVLVFLAL